MTCTNCALGVQKIIEKNGGENCEVNFSTGEAVFSGTDEQVDAAIVAQINSSGYKVIQNEQKANFIKSFNC